MSIEWMMTENFSDRAMFGDRDSMSNPKKVMTMSPGASFKGVADTEILA
jgi:hypothetical protein